VITLDVEQGSAAWIQVRIGIPTASQFDRILTNSGKPSASVAGYRNELLAEWLLGDSLSEDVSLFMERGTAQEADARKYYEFQRDVTVQQVGFCLRDDRRAGCSPDGLVGTGGGMEIKVPSPKVHMGYLLDGAGAEYKAQVQGNLLITEREWWDFLSYHGRLPCAIVRIVRDEPYIKLLNGALNSFCDYLDDAKTKLIAAGHIPKLRPQAEAIFAGVG
jgi:hypothetical protein